MMKELKSKKEYELIKDLKNEINWVEKKISEIQKENSELIDLGDLEAVKKIKDNCKKLLTTFDKEEINNLKLLIKSGNTILIKTTDAISFTEDQFYHIVDQNPDWRGLIRVSLVKVGHGDYGNWISYDEVHFIKPIDFIVLLKTYKHSLVDFKQMDKYIQFTKTIPE